MAWAIRQSDFVSAQMGEVPGNSANPITVWYSLAGREAGQREQGTRGGGVLARIPSNADRVARGVRAVEVAAVVFDRRERYFEKTRVGRENEPARSATGAHDRPQPRTIRCFARIAVDRCRIYAPIFAISPHATGKKKYAFKCHQVNDTVTSRSTPSTGRSPPAETLGPTGRVPRGRARRPLPDAAARCQRHGVHGVRGERGVRVLPPGQGGQDGHLPCLRLAGHHVLLPEGGVR